MSPTCTSYREWVRQIKSTSMLEKQTNTHLGQIVPFFLPKRFKANMKPWNAVSKCKLANIHEAIISINCRYKRKKTLYKQQNLRGQHFFFVHIAHIPALGGGQLTLKFIFRLTVHFGFLFVECMMMESHKFCFVWELTLSWA